MHESSFVLSRQEKKPFSMNPNADIFRSMYPQQAMSMTQQQHAAGQMAAGGQAMPSAHDSKFYSQSMQSSDYQGMYVRQPVYVECGSSAVECHTCDRVSPVSNPLFATVSKIGNFYLSTTPQFTQLYK